MRSKKTLYFGLIIALVVFLAACTAVPAPVTQPAPAVREDVSLPDSSATPILVQVKPTATVPASELPTATEDYPEPAANSPTPTRTVRSELAATDPQTVQLASGRPQLVEFFAFW